MPRIGGESCPLSWLAHHALAQTGADPPLASLPARHSRLRLSPRAEASSGAPLWQRARYRRWLRPPLPPTRTLRRRLRASESHRFKELGGACQWRLPMGLGPLSSPTTKTRCASNSDTRPVLCPLGRGGPHPRSRKCGADYCRAHAVTSRGHATDCRPRRHDSVHPSISHKPTIGPMYTSLVRVCNAVSGVGIDLKTTASIKCRVRTKPPTRY